LSKHTGFELMLLVGLYYIGYITFTLNYCHYSWLLWNTISTHGHLLQNAVVFKQFRLLRDAVVCVRNVSRIWAKELWSPYTDVKKYREHWLWAPHCLAGSAEESFLEVLLHKSSLMLCQMMDKLQPEYKLDFSNEMIHKLPTIIMESVNAYFTVKLNNLLIMNEPPEIEWVNTIRFFQFYQQFFIHQINIFITSDKYIIYIKSYKYIYHNR